MCFSRLLCGLLCLAGTSCFTLRPVEPPQQVSSDWVSPTDHEILLTNLRTAISQTNVQNYLRCFNRDSLVFNPVSSLYNTNESIWVNWSFQDEQTYLENALADLSVNSGQSLLLEEQGLQDVTADSLRYVGRYTLRVNHQDTSLTTLFKGQLQLSIKRNAFNEWEIHRWTDIQLAPDSSI